ncbi:AAA-domain-containing protein [Aspergillus ellipticus CBS 707.79]|uniref:AAA-domain-containing protein n=1 Tax=Aspergillus ellipticus CBS 707.79 TaxID=1448320 RepID=A0A319DB20_9EURO|nr:AAA-domain-containing protein [Aspergillus ellipticus CBS 707.79]
MMRPKPASSLQKTYDDCYLMCSTAVYFEGQNNEEEALRSWRSALETIYYHNAYRLSSQYTPKNETERALQDSIRQLELQCSERVDLLQALRESRKDSTGRSPPRATPGWIGDGTVPAVGYTDLSKPPTIPGRPPPKTTLSSESIRKESISAATPSPAPIPIPAQRTQSHSSSKTDSRTPSPDRRKIMPFTLRNSDVKKPSKKKDSSRRRDVRPAAASQAAGLAWGSIYPTFSSPDKTASDAALASSRLNAPNDPALRRQSEPRRPHSGDERIPRRPMNTAEDPDSRRTGRKLRAPDQAVRRSPAKKSASSTPRTTPAVSTHRLPAVEVQQPTPRSHSASVGFDSGDAVRPQFPPKPSVKPKPVALRSPNPTSSSPGPSAGTPDRLPAKSTSRPRVTPSSSGDDGLVPGLDRMTLSAGSPVRQAPRLKHDVTPPSSDPESLGPKSTDLDEEDEADEDEDDAIMDIMNKLPKGVDVMAARQILNDIVVRGDEVHWDDIAGLDGAKKALKEAVVYPFLRPDLFSGLREPARGMLLFGPPGTGKTMLARAVATESKSTFFSVSASTLTSKWHGESEKLVRALFGLAKALAPSIIFVDEIDSLLSARSSGTENEASRRSKTEFLIQWSDLQRAAAGREQKDKKMGDASRVLVLAATNMPWDIDEAARRRFVRRQYIPLPEHGVREQQLSKLLSHQVHELSDEDIEVLVHVTEGFSGSDMTALAKDAAMGPLRNLGEALLHTPMDQIRAIRFQDFEASLSSIRPSVSREGLQEYEEWAKQFGERGG